MLLQEYYYTKIGSSQDLVIPKERLIYRFFEILPGTLAWSTLAGIVALSYFTPIFAAFFIIAFDTYWLFKTIYLSLHLRSAFKKVKENLKINWLSKLIQNEELRIKNWSNIYHLIILPFYNESYETIRASIESLANANYPKDKMIVVLGAEEKALRQSSGQAGYNPLIIAEKIKKE